MAELTFSDKVPLVVAENVACATGEVIAKANSKVPITDIAFAWDW